MRKLKLFGYIIFLTLIHSQEKNQINTVKNLIKSGQVTKDQIKQSEAYKQAFKEKVKKTVKSEEVKSENSNDQTFDSKKFLPELGESNQVKNENEIKENNDSDVEDKKSKNAVNSEDNYYLEKTELDIIDESNLESRSDVFNVNNSLSYFGYDIFKKDPALFQSSSFGAVDPDYLIGPSDEIIVMLWGETQFRQVLTVNREGFVFIPEIGQVFVNGLNLSLLESKLFRVFSQAYSSLNPQGAKPTTFLDVSLGNLRPLRIQVLGALAQPGAYTVSPSTTLFSSLYFFNGPTSLGSLRDIHLIRGGEKISSIDFYDYLLKGKKPNDQNLQLDDVIFIPNRLKTVTIQGEINRPGIYELKENETLDEIIKIAGDLKITAYLERAQIDRIVPFKKRLELGMDRMVTDVNLEEIMKSDKKFNLQDGDIIKIFSVLELRKNIVSIKGSVTRPGSYDLGDSLTLRQLIEKSDGLLGDAYLNRVDIVRNKPDFSEELIKFNLNDETNNDIELKSLDRVRVYGMTEMVPKTYVSITGHVKKSGRYQLQENMNLFDLIFKAGGYVDEEYKKRTYLERAELVRYKDDSDDKEIISFNLGKVLKMKDIASTLLKADDAVRIYSLNEIKGETRFVSIKGHVKRPGFYELFEKNMTLFDLIFKAGGFEDEEYMKATYLKRAELIRTSSNNKKEIIKFDLSKVINKTGASDTLLKHNDVIVIYSMNQIEGETQFVTIDGQVKNPGIYELFEKNMTLYDLLFRAGGFEDDNFLSSVYQDRLDITRDSDDGLSKIIISKNLSEILKNPESNENLKLLPGDKIKVYSKKDFNFDKTVTIVGVVNNPGKYFLKKDMTIKDLVLEAGGVAEDVFNYKIELSRINLKRTGKENYSEIINIDMLSDFSVSSIDYFDGKNQNNLNDFVLMPYDFAVIRPDPFFKQQQIVTIEGEVYYPGEYAITNSDETISDIINRAGGVTKNSYPFGSSFFRNGDRVRIDLKKILKNPKHSSNINVQNLDKIIVSFSPKLIEVKGSINAPGFYKYKKNQRMKNVIKEAGGLNSESDKNNIYITFPNGVSRKYNPIFSNYKVKDNSVIYVGKKEKVEPLDKTEYFKEVTSILANFAQVISIIILAKNN